MSPSPDDVSLRQKTEALLFAAGRAVTFSVLAHRLGVSEVSARAVVTHLAAEWKKVRRGVSLLVAPKSVEMVTSPDVTDLVEQYFREELKGNLTRSALETLAIVAYRQPVSRAEIDTIRGVHSALMLRSLAVRGLVDRHRRGGQFVYTISHELMKYLGITRQEELPDFAELAKKAPVHAAAKDQAIVPIRPDTTVV